ncbi:hypothetical protein HPB48_012270 [Haemaphysalis longicornis]|uniref:FP protein C-terminal domain-containing protein n=1 Tax=Haemaphysalis longicornis TaxID=44386 RepID=A0A9J6GXT7_HAELO|nr:hypothetical protein HPB48_012270 [Haemaphysalis longicornis]
MTKVSKEVTTALDELKSDIKTDLKVFRESIDRDFRTDLREIKASLKFISDKYDEMRVDLKSVLEQNKQLRAENITLKERCDKQETQLKATESRIVDCEQYSRNANVEIKGILVRDEENLFDILTEIGNCIEEPISPCDVDVCHRVPVPNDRASKNIIFQYIHGRKRNAVLEAAKKMKLTCEDLGLSHTAPIFINEHLCPDRKRLLVQAIAMKREAGWKFVWVRNGNIYARKSEKSNALKIGSASDLVKMT